ncbi:MAG: hypothetical protein H0W50_09955 [Parachlamydiaceae bacterium]|nr:hypothetical protein [Parachlamydiaceae bacterium]
MTIIPFKLAVICGGPSKERGISLNSARSVMDHLSSPRVEIFPLFVDWKKQFYQISPAQLYSNTPADFDFKLTSSGNLLDNEALEALLKSVDLVFPVIHGAFGEDGELQSILESFEVPFVGHSSASCKGMFNKYLAAEKLRSHHFPTLPQCLIATQDKALIKKIVTQFFEKHNLQRAIVKPTIGGSSIDVYSVTTIDEACERLDKIFSSQNTTEALLESFCIGKEFTVVVFDNSARIPIALIPTEISLCYADNQIFDFRKKYLPSNQAAYHTPPRFSRSIVDNIRSNAEQLFELFEMKDFVRLDGWVMEDGTLYFTDINPVSGLEQNSFLFRQSTLLGMTHRQTLEFLIENCCNRYGLHFPPPQIPIKMPTKSLVYVLFGNSNAERQVSLMSGTNVWLKLLQSEQLSPSPFLFDPQGNIWELPYDYTLNHTVEEIYSNCVSASENQDHWQDLLNTICDKLEISNKPRHPVKSISQEDFFNQAKENDAFIFIAMHGGAGEDGTIQRALEHYNLSYNGSDSVASALCMDKMLSGQVIQSLKDPELISPDKKGICFAEFMGNSQHELSRLWNMWTEELQTHQLIVKPRFDGCSAGIVLLESAEDLQSYCRLLHTNATQIPAFTFPMQDHPIEMPSSLDGEFILEPFIETDEIRVAFGEIQHISKNGWIELTVGVLEQHGIYRALNPSITVAECAVLSLEEKFQGGTGINLTPPPEEILSAYALQKIKHLVIKAAKALGIQNYARLDVFFNRLTEKMILIEANTLPGLTASTVIYHQGLAENPPLTPLKLLETIIASKCPQHTVV